MLTSITEMLDLIARDQGFDSRVGLIDHPQIMLDSCQPGVCRNCEAVTEPHEPDAENNYCELCGKNEVISAGALMMYGALE